MKTNIVLAAFIGMLCGCTSGKVLVPSNEVTFKSANGSLVLKHPQNTEMDGVDVTIDISGTVSAKIDKLRTTNDPDVIQRTAEGQAKIVEATGTAVVNGIRATSEVAGTLTGAALKQAAK